MDNDTYDNSRPPRRNNGGNRFGGPRKRFDNNGEGNRFDRPRKRFSRPRFDDNGEAHGESVRKPRRFSGERKSFDKSRFDGSRFDGNGEGGNGGDGDRKPRRFFGDRKSFDRPRFDGNGEGGDRKPRRFFGDRKSFDGNDGDGDRKPRRFFGDRKSFDRPRFDGNGEGGDGDRKPRRFFDDRKSFDRPRFDGNGGDGDRKPRRFFGDRKSFDRPRFDGPRFDGNDGDGDRKPRRFSDDGPRRRIDGNGEGSDGGFKPRRFSDDRPRKTLDSNVVGRRFDIDESGEDEGGFKPRRFSDERKSLGGSRRFSGDRPRFDCNGEDIEDGFKSRRYEDDGSPHGLGDSEKPALAVDDTTNSDLAESFATPPATDPAEEPVKEERPAPKPLPFPKHRSVAVFGGSFDPIHNGHLMMAEYILARGLADEILFIPSAIPPHKAGMTVATPEQRLEMVRLATAYNERFSYSDMELRREGKSYSFDTVTLLQKLYPDYKLSFIIGMDSLCQLQSWYRATELVQKVDFIIYPRPNVQPPAYIDLCAAFGNRNALRLLNAVLPYHDSVVTYEPSTVEGEPDKRIVTEYDLPSSQLSSTEIRKALVDGNLQLLQEALPEAVLNYVTENKLYRQ